jgi:toxin-antitoxin system PIN domain toxin
VSRCLLDVNVLIALTWPEHNSHAKAARWFAARLGQGWATCPFTQSGFVRILSNPSFSSEALTPTDALDLLGVAMNHPHHEFWADDISFHDAVRNFEERLLGHQQVSDAYLLGLAVYHQAKLATLDTAILTLAKPGSAAYASVELI